MIIELLLDGFYVVFSLLLTPIHIPSLPDDIFVYLEQFFEYIITGKEILSAYLPLDYILILVAIAFTIEIAILVYHFIMWVIKKIPMINVK